MTIAKHKIAPCLWFDTQASDAARFYCSIFKNSKIGRGNDYPDAGKETHGKNAGSKMAVEFELEGMPFLALNGGPHFTFNEAVSFQVFCETQDEIDYYWNALTADGGQESRCGWLKDKFGLSWQVVPAGVAAMLSGQDPAAASRVMKAVMQMKKFDIAAIERAYAGA
jgi:predicted 3-demethylubiquinone-9 3-methyltransferase (glyoxalase superfamily)